MTEDLQEAAREIDNVLETVPSPSKLVHQLNRDWNMTQIAELVNDGKRNSVHQWREKTRQPLWNNYVKLLYACGYRIVKQGE